MDRCAGAAARLLESERKDLAIQALARSETVSDLAARHGVSRKFVYQQTHKAVAALDDAFLSATPDHEVLFALSVTQTWLRQVIVGLPLICRSSYRGVVEFLRDLLGLSISVGTVHHVLQSAARQADIINHDQNLSGIRVGLHDEIFQGATPVLAGVDAASTHCYLLAAEERRDADTWGVHLLDAAQQGLDPDYSIADAGQGLRAGQRAAWGDTPCHGDVFHIQRQCEGLANTLARLAKGATSRRKTLQARIGRAGQRVANDELATQLALARQAETQVQRDNQGENRIASSRNAPEPPSIASLECSRSIIAPFFHHHALDVVGYPSFWRALITSIPAWWFDAGEPVQVEIDDRLQRLGGRAAVQAVRKHVQPGSILYLQRKQIGHGIASPLWTGASIRWSAIANDGRLLGHSDAVTGLPLGIAERAFAVGSTILGHVPTTVT